MTEKRTSKKFSADATSRTTAQKNFHHPRNVNDRAEEFSPPAQRDRPRKII
jgi:hypothetical protein